MLITGSWAQYGAFLLACGMLSSGCGGRDPNQAARQVLKRHFQSIATNGFETAMVDYGPEFFKKTEKGDWSQELAKLNGKLGAYQRHAVVWSRAFNRPGPFGAGTTVNVKCKVTYSKHSATESFTLFKPELGSDYKIAGHQFNLDESLRD